MLPSRKELSGKAESAVRRTTETTEGLDRSQESLAGAAKTKRGEKNNPIYSELSSVDMWELTWKIIHLGTKPSYCNDERLQKDQRALKYSLD